MSEIYRQGDVMLVRVDNLPAGESVGEAPQNGRIILAYGEVTGHHHAVVASDSGVLPELKWFGQQRFIEADAPFAVVHEEHDAHQFPPGVYEVVGQFAAHAKVMRPVYD